MKYKVANTLSGKTIAIITEQKMIDFILSHKGKTIKGLNSDDEFHFSETFMFEVSPGFKYVISDTDIIFPVE